MNWIHELPDRRYLKANISELHLVEGYRDPSDRVLAACVFLKDISTAAASSTVGKCMELFIAGVYLLLPDADFLLTYEIDRVNNSVTIKHPSTWSPEQVYICQRYFRILGQSHGWKVVTTKSPYGVEPYALKETWH